MQRRSKFPWRKFPDAAELVSNKYGKLGCEVLARRITWQTGIFVSAAGVRKYAITTERLNVRENDPNRVALFEVAEELGITQLGARQIARTLKLDAQSTSRTGAGGVLLVSLRVAATLRAFYPPMPPDTVSTQEAAQELNYDTSTILSMIKRGQLQSLRRGVKHRIPLAELDRMKGQKLIAWAPKGDLLGKVVEASCRLTCAFPQGPTWLVPWRRPMRIAAYRHTVIGRVVRQQANRCEIATPFGCVAVAAELVREVAEDAHEGPGDRQRAVVLALMAPRPAFVPKPPKEKEPHPWKARGSSKARPEQTDAERLKAERWMQRP